MTTGSMLNMNVKYLLFAMSLFCSNLYAADLVSQGGWLHTPNSNYGDAIVVNERIETHINKDLSIGIDGGYHGRSAHNPYGKLSGYSILGDLIYYLHVDWKLKPYLLGGLGWSWWHFDRSQDMKDKGIDINVSNTFSQKVGIGADYELGRNWSLNLEWYYFHAQVPKDSHYESNGSFANVAGGKSLGQEETNLVVGLKYKF